MSKPHVEQPIPRATVATGGPEQKLRTQLGPGEIVRAMGKISNCESAAPRSSY